MNTLKGWITTIFLLGTLTIFVTPANAGIIYGGLTDTNGNTCSEPTKSKITVSDDLGGIIFGGLTGIIYGGLTGIIYGGVANEPTVNCGIIYGG